MLHRSACLRLLGLGKSQHPSTAEIKAAYRMQAKRFHPDSMPPGSSAAVADEAALKFMQIQTAYEQLLEPALPGSSTMSESARRAMRNTAKEKSQAEIRRYHANTSAVPLRFMTAMLLALTGYTAWQIHAKNRFPHQRGYDIRDLYRRHQ